MMRTYEFDDTVLSPGRFRYHVLCALAVRKNLSELLRRQRRKCPLCKGKEGPLDNRAQVDHIKPVKWFAYNLALTLTEAYRQCHALSNLRAVHPKCNNARNRKKAKIKTKPH